MASGRGALHMGGGPGQASTPQSPTSRSRVLECQVLLKSTKCWYLQSCINYLLLYFPGGQILTLRRCCICCICCICYILEILEQILPLVRSQGDCFSFGYVFPHPCGFAPSEEASVDVLTFSSPVPDEGGRVVCELY